MKKVVIIGATRTPVGKYQGRLKTLSESDLCGLTLKKIMADSSLETGQIDELVIGNSKQTSLPSNLARYAMLDADFPVSIPAYTVQRHNASGMQAMAKAFWSLRSETSQVVLAGGAESMSQIPIEIQQGRFEFDKDSDLIFEPIERQVIDAQPIAVYGQWNSQKLATKIAQHYRLSQEDILAYSASSREKAKKHKAMAKHRLAINVKLRKTTDEVTEDYLNDHGKLVADPADGAASLLLSTADYAAINDLPISAEIVSIKTSAGHPIESGLVDTQGIKAALAAAGLNIKELDVIDIAETSAAYVLALNSELAKLAKNDSVLTSKINPYGGFLASGLPGGATSVIQTVNALDYLADKQLSTGMIVTPSDGGQTMVTIIKKECKNNDN